MKKITFFLMLLIASTSSFAQLKKVEITPSEQIGKVQAFGMPLVAECTKNDNTYTIKYKDKQFTTLDEYRSFSFEDVENTFNDLYTTIQEGFETTPKEAIMLELPDYYIFLKFEKAMGWQSLTISSSDKRKDSPIFTSNYLTKRQVEKLFGKKK